MYRDKCETTCRNTSGIASPCQAGQLEGCWGKNGIMTLDKMLASVPIAKYNHYNLCLISFCVIIPDRSEGTQPTGKGKHIQTSGTALLKDQGMHQ